MKRIKTTNEKLNGQLTNQQSWQRIQDLKKKKKKRIQDLRALDKIR